MQDLPFSKGDTLTIISSSKDPNWYKARRADGLEGMIPYNYVQKKKQQPSTSGTSSSASATSQGSGASKGGATNTQQPKLAVKLQQMPQVLLFLSFFPFFLMDKN